MSTKDEVRKASQQFYAALNSMLDGDMVPLAEIWSHGEDVTAMHPIGGRDTGWKNVQESFLGVSQIASGGQIELAEQTIQVDGDMAYELGIEQGQALLAGQDISIDNRVTNIYRREAGAWKMVHHHTDVSQAMVDLLIRLQSEM